MKFKIDELLTLKSVVDHGGFNRAAGILNKTQSSVSQKVSRLEDKVGTLLIKRDDGCSCTEAGKAIYNYASIVEAKEKEVVTELEHIINSAKPGIRLVIANASLIPLIKNILHDFLLDSDDFNFQLHIEPSRKVVSSILDGCYDIGFGFFQSNMDDFDCIPVREDDRFLVAFEGIEDIEELQRGDLNVLKKKILIATYLDDHSNRPAPKKLRSNFRLVWEISDIGFREELISKGVGLGYVDRDFLNRNKNAIVLNNYSFGEINRKCGFFYLKNYTLSTPFNNFINIIKTGTVESFEECT
ncbi:LysR family transcriptional regulator [Dasania sp. GY-MA-18]|uniref:LysR family transcriptional regulator n=1 Tax=Dasania phycosphaerae TaxID=2950436 RepID=A0A9J6RN01_9GAMM|nr:MULTISPECIES: LysR family transcriptional regulator [Dasania]MCR8923474.1 LysR family transcriptional regulator [Dasania sp. GY-MA-18]MCZ0865907.1 LysR family transcriptional regulator [Dasania phycosphaerae]MCZ0869632.1 LysR family transcriptional regulator [Dasania phycosphaerae]